MRPICLAQGTAPVSVRGGGQLFSDTRILHPRISSGDWVKRAWISGRMVEDDQVEYDFVVDGTDSFPSKFLINDACVIAGKPFSHGGILRFDGQTMTHVPGTASYRCVFKAPPPANAVPTCSQAGVFGAVAGMLGTIQAAEAIRYLTGVGDLLTNRLLIFDALNMKFRTVNVKPSELDLKEFKSSYDQPVCDLRSNA